MKWKISIFTLIIILVIGIIYQPFIKKEARESITFFPIDTSFSFAEAVTSLKFEEGTASNYELEWDVESESSESVYLRQDIAMIYENGKLTNKMTEWKTTAKSIDLEKNIEGKIPGLWEAISYHQGEIHINEEKYRSVQKMSSDYLYTVKPNNIFTGFKKPASPLERRQKNTLDQETNKYLQDTFAQLLDYYQINQNNYHVISLQSLTGYNEKALPGYNQVKSQEIIGKLWEGLYKNYFINITTKTGQKISPIGSSMPYILLSEDKTHLFVLFQTSTGENIQLIQYIS